VKKKAPRRLRRTWATRGEVLASIATRDRRRVEDQKVSAYTPSAELEYARRYIAREPDPDMLAVVNSAWGTTYAKRGRSAPELGAAFADAALALEEHIAARRIVEHPKGFRWEDLEDVWPPKGQGRPPIVTLDSEQIRRLVSLVLSRSKDEYAKKGASRATHAACRRKALKEIGVEVGPDDKRLIETLFGTALVYAKIEAGDARRRGQNV
jgi:hypothetical protein